jgi:hypothetical protein
MRWGRLRDESGAAFTAAFASGTLANTMLVTYHREGKLTRKEMIITYLVNTGLPVYLLHLPTTFFIILPLTREAGLVYMGLTLAAACLKSSGLLLYSRFKLPSSERSGTTPLGRPRKEAGSWMVEVWKKFKVRFSRVILFTIPIYVLIFFLNEGGLFAWIREGMARWISLSFFPVEAASVVVFSVAAEFTSGMAAAGALLDAGALSIKQTVIALVLGSIVAAPIRAFRHQLPYLAGIFSPGLGTKLLLLSQGTRILSLMLVTIPFFLW